jgi:hypothetical protein
MPGNVAWKFEGRLSVMVHGPVNPTNLEWQRFLRDAVDGRTGTHWRNLVVSYGGRPDGEQRKQLAEMLKGRAAPTAIMTGNAVVRAAVVAISFFNRKMKAFALDDFDGACSYLELTPDERRRARAFLAELTQALGLSAHAVAS